MKILFALAIATSFVSVSAVAAQPSDGQMEAAFKKADPDNDGTVSRIEALKFGITQKVFNHANPDKDGTFDLAG